MLQGIQARRHRCDAPTLSTVAPISVDIVVMFGFVLLLILRRRPGGVAGPAGAGQFLDGGLLLFLASSSGRPVLPHPLRYSLTLCGRPSATRTSSARLSSRTRGCANSGRANRTTTPQ